MQASMKDEPCDMDVLRDYVQVCDYMRAWSSAAWLHIGPDARNDEDQNDRDHDDPIDACRPSDSDAPSMHGSEITVPVWNVSPEHLPPVMVPLSVVLDLERRKKFFGAA